MNLKYRKIANRRQILRHEQILGHNPLCNELELPGEPLIYSIKYAPEKRRKPIQFFRNKQWRSIIRCFFPTYDRTKTSVVLWVRFYVSPPSHATVKKADVKKENTPAVHAYELCDYLLSFLEILRNTLVWSHRQYAKIDMEKYYSDRPRIVFKFMRWEHYVSMLKDQNTVHPESKGFMETRPVQHLQPISKGNEPDAKVCGESTIKAGNDGTPGGPSTGDSSLPNPCPKVPPTKKKKSTTPPPTLQET